MKAKAVGSQLRSEARAFTLIELLVVIAIIGILSSVVLASLSGARESAKEANILQNLSSAQTEAALYYNENGSYSDICSNSKIDSIVASASSTADRGAVCWEATNSSTGVDDPQALADIDWAIGVSNADNYYAVSSQGAGTFSDEDAVSGGIDWNSAKTACSDAGKRLPTASELRAIYGIEMDMPVGDYTGTAYWSSVEAPTQSGESYATQVNNGWIYHYDQGQTNYVRCIE